MKYILLVIFLMTAASVYAIPARQLLDNSFMGISRPVEQEAKVEILKEFRPGNSTHINRCVFNANHTPITLGGKIYIRGIGVHADSLVRFTFRQPIRAFRTKAGVDSAALGKNSQDICTITADGKEVYKSGLMRADNSVLDIDLALNCRVLELGVERPDKKFDTDWFSWADTRVITSDGKTIYLDELLGKTRPVEAYPFSFTYGGVSSSELLPGWDLRTEVRETGTGTEKTYTWTDPKTHLEVMARALYYNDVNSADWTIYFTNKGTENTPVISALSSFDLNMTDISDAPIIPECIPAPFARQLPLGDRKYRQEIAVLTMAGSSGCMGFNWDEFKITPVLLQNDKPISVHHGGLAPTYGSASPYYTVKWPDGGVVFAIGWTGNWFADISRTDDTLRIAAGRDNVNTYLKPGESIRSARILASFYDGPDMQTGLNTFRQTMIRHITPKKDGKPMFIPLSYYVSWKETTRATAQDDLRYIKALRGMSFDTLWFDAWYTRNSFPNGMGNYHFPISDIPDPVRYPKGIKPFTMMSKSLGKDVILWFAPETVMADTFIAREHPEWVMSTDGGKSGFFALVNPEARAYMADVLTACFRDWKVDIFRTDSFTEPSQLMAYTKETAPDRQGIAENMFATSLYAFWDELLERTPGLHIDNCAGGGTRLDLELMSRSLSMWRSDSNVGITDPKKISLLGQYFTSNLNTYIPWSTGSCFGYTPYDFRSCFNGGLDFKRDIPFSDEDVKTIEKGLAECRRIEKYCLGNFYTIINAGWSNEEWCCWQYHRPQEGDGCFVVFRREASSVFGQNINLREIDESQKYKVDIYETFELKESKIMTGAQLRSFRAVIEAAPGSLLVEYSPLK